MNLQLRLLAAWHFQACRLADLDPGAWLTRFRYSWRAWHQFDWHGRARLG